MKKKLSKEVKKSLAIQLICMSVVYAIGIVFMWEQFTWKSILGILFFIWANNIAIVNQLNKIKGLSSSATDLAMAVKNRIHLLSQEEGDNLNVH